jgi:hypothetical protein
MNTKYIELAHLRNRLARGCFDDEDKQLLELIEHKILSSNSPLKDIALNAIENCKESISSNEFMIAMQELQLIHNFTFDDFSKWNSEYFYRVELLSYLEEVDKVSRIKKLISLLAKIL